MSSDGAKDKNGGLAYDVILAPSRGTTPKKPASSPREKPLSQEIIAKKLKDAEERRLSLEQSKLQLIVKQKERAQVAVKKVEDLNDSFSKETKEKLEQKFQVTEEKRAKQLDTLKSRVKDHIDRVEYVRTRFFTHYSEELKERLNTKMETYQSNRQSQISQVQERLQEHERHVKEVLDASQKMNEDISKVTEEKMMKKMQSNLKNREGQLQSFVEKMRQHEKHVQQVREKAKTATSDCNDSLNDEGIC